MEELRRQVEIHEKCARHIALRQEKLLVEARDNKRALLCAKRRLREYPKVLYASTEAMAPTLTTELINYILWFYVRLEQRNYVWWTCTLMKDLALLRYFDVATRATVHIHRFYDFLRESRAFELLTEGAKWNGCRGVFNTRPKWTTEPIRGKSLKEALRGIPDQTFKAGPVRITLFGEDCFVRFKCKKPEQVFELCCRNGIFRLFRFAQRAEMCEDGFRVPYQNLNLCQCEPSVVGCSRCRWSFLINRQSWRLKVVYH